MVHSIFKFKMRLTDVGAASSGLAADASTLVEHARVETQVGRVIHFHFIHFAVIVCDVLLHRQSQVNKSQLELIASSSGLGFRITGLCTTRI